VSRRNDRADTLVEEICSPGSKHVALPAPAVPEYTFAAYDERFHTDRARRIPVDETDVEDTVWTAPP